jgi:protein TonB
MEFLGRRGVVLIEASFAEPPAPESVVEVPRLEAPVEVTPQEARIAARQYWQTPTTIADFAPVSAEVELLTDAQEAIAPRPLQDEPSPTAAPSELPPVERTNPSPPQTAGFESAVNFAGNPPPIYPAIALQNGWSGSVLLKLVIDEKGAVTSVAVERSSGYAVLDAAAVNAVRRWRGEPKRVNGRPEATVELQEIKFLPRSRR